MAEFDKYITCDNNNIDLRTILKSIMGIDNDGVAGIRVLIKSKSADQVTNSVGCDNNPDLETLVRERFALDTEGNVALVLFDVTD